MQAVLIGNILDSILEQVIWAIPYEDRPKVRGALEDVIPETGIVVEATLDELKDTDELGSWLYNDIEIKQKERR